MNTEKEIILSLRNMLNHVLIMYGENMTKFDTVGIIKRLDETDKFLQKGEEHDS